MAAFAALRIPLVATRDGEKRPVIIRWHDDLDGAEQMARAVLPLHIDARFVAETPELIHAMRELCLRGNIRIVVEQRDIEVRTERVQHRTGARRAAAVKKEPGTTPRLLLPPADLLLHQALVVLRIRFRFDIHRHFGFLIHCINSFSAKNGINSFARPSQFTEGNL